LAKTSPIDLTAGVVTAASATTFSPPTTALSTVKAAFSVLTTAFSTFTAVFSAFKTGFSAFKIVFSVFKTVFSPTTAFEVVWATVSILSVSLTYFITYSAPFWISLVLFLDPSKLTKSSSHFLTFPLTPLYIYK